MRNLITDTRERNKLEYYKSILRALGNHFAKIDGIDLSNLLKVSVELKIVSGYTNWLNRIEEAIVELTSDYNYNNNAGVKIEIYKQVENGIKKIKMLLQPFHKKLTPQEFLQHVFSLIFKLNIPRKILNAAQDIVEEDLIALNTFINSLRELAEILESE